MVNDSVPHTTDNSFSADVLESDTPVLVDFGATWCSPCKAIEPHVEAVADAFNGQAKVVKMDIDSNPQTPAKYGVRSIPTLLVFKGGQVVDQLVGNPGARTKIAELLGRHV